MAEITIALSPADVARIADAVAARMGPALSPAELTPKLLWTETEAGQALGVSPLSLKKWRARGYIRASTEQRPILYDRAALEAAAAFIKTNAARA